MEIVNALARLGRRGLLSTAQADQLWIEINRIPVTLRQIDLQAALRLATSNRVHGYDSFMLQCCMETSTPLLTLDKGLRATAKTLGINILEP